MSDSVHIFGPTFSTLVRSIMLCCEEKGVSYSAGTEVPGRSEESVRALQPFGQIPLLLHGDFHLFETGTICRYLDHAFDGPSLQSTDARQQAIVDQWTQALNTTIDKLIVRQYLLEFAFPKGDGGSVREEVVAANSAGLLESLSVIELQLGGQAYFCGEHFSTADVLLIPMLDYVSKLPAAVRVFAEYPYSVTYIRTMQQRPSVARILLALDG